MPKYCLENTIFASIVHKEPIKSWGIVKHCDPTQQWPTPPVCKQWESMKTMVRCCFSTMYKPISFEVYSKCVGLWKSTLKNIKLRKTLKFKRMGNCGSGLSGGLRYHGDFIYILIIGNEGMVMWIMMANQNTRESSGENGEGDFDKFYPENCCLKCKGKKI